MVPKVLLCLDVIDSELVETGFDFSTFDLFKFCQIKICVLVF